MKKIKIRGFSLALSLVLLLSSCAGLSDRKPDDTSDPLTGGIETTAAPSTDNPEETSAADTNPSDTNPMDTHSPETDPPETEPSTDPIIPDPPRSFSDYAADLTAGMTLEQKIGQMLIVTVRTFTDQNGVTSNVTSLNDALKKAFQQYEFGGVILFAESASGTASTAGLVYDLQHIPGDALPDGSIPMLICADQEGGYVYRLGTGCDGCGNMALGATGDPAYAYEAASLMGSELAALGINMDFAPVLDINNNPDNPIIGVRSFSDDPVTVARFGEAFIEGLHRQNVAAALKHFPGHGDTATDSHTGLPCISKTLDEITAFELYPFAFGIKTGADMIMTAHIQYPLIEKETYISRATGNAITLPATLSQTIITDILRGQLHFEGVVCTDAMEMDAIATHFDRMDAARLAINAGVDMLLGAVNLYSQKGIDDAGAYIAGIAAMVRNGQIEEATIDAAVTRILTMKMNRGLLQINDSGTVGSGLRESREDTIRNALAVVGSKENHESEWNIALKSVTLVKNENSTLPLSFTGNEKAVIFCSYPNEVTASEFAIARLRDSGVLPTSVQVSVFCYQNRAVSEFADIIRQADAVIASVETYRTANLTSSFQAQFLDALLPFAHENGKKVTVISIQLPYDLARYQTADALLAVYNCQGMNVMPSVYNGETRAYGPNLPAAIYTVFGGSVPTGILPVNIPKLDGSLRYTSEMLYPRGFGLSGWGR